jgi:hypothetical protein
VNTSQFLATRNHGLADLELSVPVSRSQLLAVEQERLEAFLARELAPVGGARLPLRRSKGDRIAATLSKCRTATKWVSAALPRVVIGPTLVSYLRKSGSFFASGTWTPK